MGNYVSDLYKRAHVEDYLDQHLDMETALIRSEIAEAKVLKKLIHHFKTVLSQTGKILDGIPPSITLKDGAVVNLLNPSDLANLKLMLKELSKFELPEYTPELERDLYVYAFTVNYINAWSSHNPLVRIAGPFRKALTDYGLGGARQIVDYYWKHEPTGLITDVIDEQGYTWKFIDPNNEVEKVMTADNLTAMQARAKIMQRSIDGMYKKDLMQTATPPGLWVTMISYIADEHEDIETYEPFHEGLKLYDPSRYPAEESE